MWTAMPCQVGRPGSDILCAPTTDPTGFIYPTYRAAQTETQRHKPSLKDSHEGLTYVSSAVGGSVSTLSFEDTTPRNYWSPPKNLCSLPKEHATLRSGHALIPVPTGRWFAPGSFFWPQKRSPTRR